MRQSNWRWLDTTCTFSRYWSDDNPTDGQHAERKRVTIIELYWPARLSRWIQLRREHECALFNVKSWSNRDFSLAWISDACTTNDVCLGLRHWTSITREEILAKWLSFKRSLRFPPRNLSRTDEWQIDSSKCDLLISSRCALSLSVSGHVFPTSHLPRKLGKASMFIMRTRRRRSNCSNERQEGRTQWYVFLSLHLSSIRYIWSCSFDLLIIAFTHVFSIRTNIKIDSWR